MGFNSIEDCLNSLSFEEYTFWQAYFSVYPFREDRADNRTAMLAYYIVSQYVKNVKIEDLMPKYEDRQPIVQDKKTISSMILAMNKIYGGKDERKEKIT